MLKKTLDFYSFHYFWIFFIGGKRARNAALLAGLIIQQYVSENVKLNFGTGRLVLFYSIRAHGAPSLGSLGS